MNEIISDGSTNQVTGLILAGGMARRMDGQDKGLIEFNGIPMVVHVANGLNLQCDQIIVNANRNLDAYKQHGHQVINDEIDDFQGPLAGMYAGLGKIETEWMITAPCDGPFMADDYVSRMLEAICDSKHSIAVATCAGRLQPVYALINHSLRQSLGAYLGGEDRKIDRWYQQHPFTEVDFSDSPDMFENINTPEQLMELESKISC